MAHNQIVFVDSEEEISDLEAKYTVTERMDLAEEGFAVVVETRDESEVDEINQLGHENYDETLEFTIRTAPDETPIETQVGDYATLESVRNLHKARASIMGDGSGVTWVVNDSGIDNTHPIFHEGQVAERHDMTSSGGADAVGHGTACAGQIARLAPRTELIDLRIFGSQGSTSMKIVLRALEWLVNNTDRYDGVNMSWGTTKKVQKIDDVINRLHEKGVRVVVAAGNSKAKEGSPATAKHAFSVGSCDKNGNVSPYTTYGPDIPEIMALGENIKLARASGTSMGRPINANYTVASGTSFSGPNQSGFESAYLSANPDATFDQMQEDFISTAEDVSGTDKDGAGLTNVKAAFERRGEKKPPADDVEEATATVWSFAGNDSIYVGADFLQGGQYTTTKQKLREAFEEK